MGGLFWDLHTHLLLDARVSQSCAIGKSIVECERVRKVLLPLLNYFYSFFSSQFKS